MNAKDARAAANAAMEQTELYYAAHPGSPFAVRRPRLSTRGDLWIALLGPSVEEGIIGIGATVNGGSGAARVRYAVSRRPASAESHYQEPHPSNIDNRPRLDLIGHPFRPKRRDRPVKECCV
jgi:hypothetical protein